MPVQIKYICPSTLYSTIEIVRRKCLSAYIRRAWSILQKLLLPLHGPVYLILLCPWFYPKHALGRVELDPWRLDQQASDHDGSLSNPDHHTNIEGITTLHKIPLVSNWKGACHLTLDPLATSTLDFLSAFFMCAAFSCPCPIAGGASFLFLPAFFAWTIAYICLNWVSEKHRYKRNQTQGVVLNWKGACQLTVGSVYSSTLPLFA